MSLLTALVRFFRGGRSTSELAAWLNLPEPELREWVRGRPPEPRGWNYSYSRFTIPKRRGGARSIEAPSDALKSLQRSVLRRLLNPLPFHAAATGFVPGRSIVDNARPHAGRGVVINIDLENFFPSITAEQVRKAFRSLGWGRAAAAILTNICTHEGRLPQGAPTSPALSNLACRRLDARLAALVKKAGGGYTRYADDITVSFHRFGRNKPLRPKPADREARPRSPRSISRGYLSIIKRIIEDEGFRIQMKKKVRVQRSHQRQTATGLVLNREVNLPRALRRRIRAMRHRRQSGRLSEDDLQRLRGLEAFQRMVETQRKSRAQEGGERAGA